MSLDVFKDPVWQMSSGERAAVEGVLSLLAPALAIEIGTADGACLQRIATKCTEVHSFDLSPPTLEQPDNVVLHTGDSHELLPPFLAACAQAGRNIDLVTVDGDHTPDGVRRDLEDLLDSPAVAHSLILIHDTANERVRRGVDAVRFGAWPKVAHVELDWIPGKLFAEPDLRNQLWYGLGLVVIDSSRLAYQHGQVYEQRYHPTAPLLAEVRDLVVARESGASSDRDQPQTLPLRVEIARLGAELRAAGMREQQLEAELLSLRERVRRADQTVDGITGSASWRMTVPLRAIKRRLQSPSAS